MKVKLSRLVHSFSSFATLCNTPMTLTMAWKLKTVMRTVSPLVMDFNEARDGLIRSYGMTTDQDGQEVNYVPDDEIESYTKQIEELLRTELDLDIEPIDVTELSNALGDRSFLTPTDVDQLDWLLTFD